MVYVHAADTSRYFIFNFQEKQGNRIEVKIEKARKVPVLTEPSPPTTSKFIPMQEEDFWPAQLSDFNGVPWSPEAQQITQFREFINKEIIRSA